jgi:hypothetical protein
VSARAIAAAAAVALVAPAAARAEAPPPPSAYNLEIFYGPAFGSSRIIGLGGAYTAIAEGAEGLLYNPAAIANRYRYSLRWLDYDLGFDYYFFLLGDKTDFDNDRLTRYSSFSQLMFFLAPALHLGPFSFGLNWIHQSFSLGRLNLARPSDLDVNVLHFDLGYRFFEGALVVGLGGRLLSVGLSDCTVASSFGTTRPELGVLWRPAAWPVRFGASFRTGARPEGSPCADSPIPTPNEVIVPWELELGFAFQLGARVFNRPWKNPRVRDKARAKEIEAVREARRAELRAKLSDTPPADRARVARDWDANEKKIRAEEDELLEAWREHVADHDDARLRAEDRLHTLFSFDLLVTGPVGGALGVEAALTNAARYRAALSRPYAAPGDGVYLAPRLDGRTTLSPRLGVETEVWHDRLKVRTGTYLEPARYEGTHWRLHFTSGVELRLFYWTPPILLNRLGVRVGATGDFSSRYINLSLSVGLWH